MDDRTFERPDGRTVAYADLGHPDGRPVVFFHGAPSSRLALVAIDGALADAGVRVLAPDRPGFGGSSPLAGRSIADAVDDAAALATALGLDRFAVAGHSSGGPYAVAAAALLGERVTGAVVAAGVTDMSWADARQGYVEVELAVMDQPDEDAATTEAVRRFGADGGGFLGDSGFAMPAPDTALLDDPIEGAAELDDIIEAFRQGVAGYAQDVWLTGQPWPFDPSAIAVPTHVLHGELDTLVPMAHTRHTADLVPGATLEVIPGAGHLSAIHAFPAAFAALPS